MTDLLRIVRTAEAACAAVGKHPEDALARESLLSALTSLSAALIAEVGPQIDQFGELLTEVQVWADIVRTRISPSRRPGKASMRSKRSGTRRKTYFRS